MLRRTDMVQENYLRNNRRMIVKLEKIFDTHRVKGGYQVSDEKFNQALLQHVPPKLWYIFYDRHWRSSQNNLRTFHYVISQHMIRELNNYVPQLSEDVVTPIQYFKFLERITSLSWYYYLTYEYDGHYITLTSNYPFNKYFPDLSIYCEEQIPERYEYTVDRYSTNRNCNCIRVPNSRINDMFMNDPFPIPKPMETMTIKYCLVQYYNRSGDNCYLSDTNIYAKAKGSVIQQNLYKTHGVKTNIELYAILYNGNIKCDPKLKDIINLFLFKDLTDIVGEYLVEHYTQEDIDFLLKLYS